jgi:hypothetical protein
MRPSREIQLPATTEVFSYFASLSNFVAFLQSNECAQWRAVLNQLFASPDHLPRPGNMPDLATASAPETESSALLYAPRNSSRGTPLAK